MSAPLNVFNVQESTHSLTLNASTSGGEQKLPVDKTEVVVSALVGMSMSEDGSRKAVHRALTRGLTFAEIDELIERYQRLAQTDTRMTVAWLYRWLTGQSRPPEPKRTVERPRPATFDRAEFERLRKEAIAAAQADEPLGEQLRRIREAKLSPAEASG